MRFRPCIDIHNGKVKQIVGQSLKDLGDSAVNNFVSEYDAAFYAEMYANLGLCNGHVILLNAGDSPFYEETKKQALLALSRTPGRLQVGGGINADNAKEFLDAGASHVIVTSYVFKDGKINFENLEKMVKTVGKKHLVIDLSCKKKNDSYYVVTDRWQKFSDTKLNPETMDMLSNYCDEFLVHAADVEGQQNGIEEDVAGMLGDWAFENDKKITYAGGIHSFDDIKILKRLGKSKIDVTIGSALKIFGGNMELKKVVDFLSKE